MIEQLGVKLKNFSANEPSGEKPASVRQRRAASRLIDLQNSAGRSAGLWSTLAAPFHRSIHIRFQYVFGAAVFGLVFMALIAIISSRTLLKTYESSVEEMLQEMTAIEQLETSLRQANQLVFLYTVNGDQSALMRFNEIAEDIDPQFHLLARAEVRFASVRYSNSELALPVFTAAWHEAEAALQEVFRYAPGTPEAINALAQLNEVIEPIYGTFSEFRSLSLQDVQSHLKSAQSAGTQAIFTIFGGILAGLVLLIFLGIVVGRSVLQPIAELQLAAGKLGRKDFTHRVKLQNTRDELGQLGRAFNVAATALQRLYRELERRSTHDGLTDVLNRAGFDERFSAECQSAIELDMPLALLLVDVDFFKQVNDTHGHQVGDRVLQVVAGLLGETLRPDDVVARYGGEEFAIILPETDEQSAMAIAQRLLTAIENASIKEGDGEDISVTVSIGCASHQEHGMTPEDFVKNADAALYEAKQTGRNRVVSESDRLLSEYAHWNTDAA
tara:strand:+ start:1650 stop:3149 length:1500 start_codon:yes stop_codon:yes gene_type:complete